MKSKREIEKLIDETIGDLKSQGVYDGKRRECLANIDDNPRYQDLLDRVEGYVKRFLHNTKWSPSTNKAQLRNRLRNEINNSKMIERTVYNLVDQLIHKYDVKDQMRKPIKASLQDKLGITEESPRKSVDEKPETLPGFSRANFEETSEFVNEVEMEIEPESNSPKYETNPCQFKQGMLEMDRISSDDSFSDSPTPPLMEILTPRRVEEEEIKEEPMDIDSAEASPQPIEVNLSQPIIPQEPISEVPPPEVTDLPQPKQPIEEETSQVTEVKPELEPESQKPESVPEKESIPPQKLPEPLEIKPEHEEEETVQKTETKVPQVTQPPKPDTPIKSKLSRESKGNPIDSILDALIEADRKNSYSDEEISDVSSVHTSDLSDFDDRISFSDSDVENLSCFKIREILDKIEKFRQQSSDDEEEIQPVKKESKKSKKNSKKSKKKVKRAKESTPPPSRRKRISSISSDCSIPSKVEQVDSPESSPETPPPSKSSKSLKRKRQISNSTDSSIVSSSRSKKTKVQTPKSPAEVKPKPRKSTKAQQSYDASDLYKPRNSVSSRRNRHSMNDNPISPDSVASTSTQDS